MADQPAPGPAGDQRGHRPHPDRPAGRGRPGVPGRQPVRPHHAAVQHLGRLGSAATASAHADAAGAESILTKAGYKKDSAGYYALAGKEVALKVEDPAAYSDYAQDDQIIASELKAAGINATFYGTSTPAVWNTDLSAGNFQLSMHWGNSGITPYSMYQNWLDDTLVNGANTSGDYGRLKSPQVETMLAKIAGDQPGSPQQVTDFQPLLSYVAANLPVIPTVNSAQWFQANSTQFSGWPSAANPYESGQPSGSNNGPLRHRRVRAPAPHAGLLSLG